MNSLDKQIQLLAKVNTSPTLTALADKLYLSQPYVSRLLKEMEAKYQVTLVNRQRRPISLTHAGEVILTNLKQIQIAQLNLDQATANLQRLEHQHVTIQFSLLIDEQPLLDLITHLLATHPETKFDFIINQEEPQVADLLQRNIDILIGPKWNHPLFNIKTLQLNELALLIPKSCPLYRPQQRICPFSENHLTSLNHSPYIATSTNSALQQRVTAFLAANQITIDQVATVSSARFATKLAVQTGATTITTTAIAQTVLTPADEYNLMPFPKEILNLEVAITMLRSPSPLLQRIYLDLYQTAQTLWA